MRVMRMVKIQGQMVQKVERGMLDKPRMMDGLWVAVVVGG
jgi:hypothetical protein